MSESLFRLHRHLTEAGFTNVRLDLSDDHELVQFSFESGTNVEFETEECAYACVLRILRASGFKIGFEELALNVDGFTVEGAFLVAPLAEICRGRRF